MKTCANVFGVVDFVKRNTLRWFGYMERKEKWRVWKESTIIPHIGSFHSTLFLYNIIEEKKI